jgi:hypothetical protein
MRLQSFINESERSVKVDESKVSKLLNGDFSQAYKQYKKGNAIYRNRQSCKENVLITNPNKKGVAKRTSPYAHNNCYNLLLNNLPAWKQMPNRDIIGSFNHNLSQCRSGFTYIIFPKNGAKIGMCPDEDIWSSFMNSGIELLDDLNYIVDNIFGIFNIEEDFYNWNSFVESSKELDEIKNDDIEEFRLSVERVIDLNYYGFINDYISSSVGLIDFLNKLLDPKKNGFDVQNIRSLNIPDTHKEIWTDSICLMIFKSEIDRILK